MVSKPNKRYAISISLKEDDWKKLVALQKNGTRVIEVFRRGLEAVEEDAKKIIDNNPVTV